MFAVRHAAPCSAVPWSSRPSSVPSLPQALGVMAVWRSFYWCAYPAHGQAPAAGWAGRTRLTTRQG
jgi:hypothetical protein